MFAVTRYTAYKRSGANVCCYPVRNSNKVGFKLMEGLYSSRVGPFSLLKEKERMDAGHFYFINDQYFIDFPDPFLMTNKGPAHDRPCFYAFLDKSTGLYWMIPFTSKISKFQAIYNSKIQRYGRCDTIDFCEVLGYRKAFLIQNMCPITAQYIKSEYIDSKANIPVRIDGRFEKQLIKKAQTVLALQRQGHRLIFPDVLNIERKLLSENK